MERFRVCTDSGCDLPYEVCEEYRISPLLMRYAIDNEVFTDTMREADARAFYDKMRAGAFPQTSSVNIEDYLEFWEKRFAENDLPIVHICLGSGISGTYQNGLLAHDLFLQDHPQAKIFVVDSLGASASYGVLAIEAARLRDEGKTAEECAAWLEKNAVRANAFYTTGDLKWLYHGGRVSRTGATVARALNIWPLMALDEVGKLYVREKVRGKKQVFARILEIARETAEDPGSQTVRVCHSDCKEDAEALARELVETCGFADASISCIGSTIGTHTGPGLVTIFFLGKERPPQKK